MHGVLGLDGFMLVFRWNNAMNAGGMGELVWEIFCFIVRIWAEPLHMAAPKSILAARALALISTLKECVADRLMEHQSQCFCGTKINDTFRVR